jgi:hypothetical protein
MLHINLFHPPPVFMQADAMPGFLTAAEVRTHRHAIKRPEPAENAASRRDTIKAGRYGGGPYILFLFNTAL